MQAMFVSRNFCKSLKCFGLQATGEEIGLMQNKLLYGFFLL